ncbi:MAG: 2-amino-4-hydroxy-6-hydroxymethyldihydropteridine diphosphokinase [Verrucomicrobiia bacterium]
MSSGSNESGGAGSKAGGASLVCVALGSNLGNSEAIIWQAIDRLQEFSDHPIRRSSLWRTDPVDCPPGSPHFVNAVVAFTARPDETAPGLLLKLQRLEKEFGRRKKSVLNAPRPLDLDLIAFGQMILATGDLVIPHPRAHCRRFVLAPLAEIAPDLVLPGQSRPVRVLLEELGSEGAVTRIPSTR